MSKLRLTVAAGDYDIVRPLKEGVVEAEGLELIFLSASNLAVILENS